MSKTPRISLSIIVPVYNEEDGIQETIKRIVADIKSKEIKRLIRAYEIIIVDDGSSDDTYKIAKNPLKRYKNIILLKHKLNQGLGAALKTGISKSKMGYITYLPADGQVFLKDIVEGLKIAPLGDLVLTYRGVRDGYNHYRNLLSNSLLISMRFIFGLNFKDYNWVHIYNKDLFKSVTTRSNGVFYLAEIVVRTYKQGLRILEAQAGFHPRSTGYSKNARPKVVIKTLLDLLRLWLELRLK